MGPVEPAKCAVTLRPDAVLEAVLLGSVVIHDA
jgi:hypothetical protein